MLREQLGEITPRLCIIFIVRMLFWYGFLIDIREGRCQLLGGLNCLTYVKEIKAMDNSHVSSAQPAGKHHTPRILTVMNLMVLVLSGLLIFFISVDTFEEVNFLENHQYMVFQFWVCIFFMIDFFVELAYTSDKLCFVKRRMAFLLLSVPYLNIINMTGMHLSGDVLYFVRFIPLRAEPWPCQ